MKLCVEGAATGAYKKLTPLQQAFYFMPLQHAESLRIQQRSVKIYEGMLASASETLKATFATFAQFAAVVLALAASPWTLPAAVLAAALGLATVFSYARRFA